MSPLTLALVQADLAWHDPATNRARLGAQLDDARLDGDVDIIVLPEMFSTGFTMTPAASFETMDGATVAWMRERAAASGAVVCGSLAMQVGNGFANRFLWVRPDGNIDHYDKRHLFRMSGEHERYVAGEQRLVIEHRGYRICPLVCYDLRFPVFARNRGDYDVLLFVANWPAPRQLAWETLLAARAIENLAYVVAVNRVGSDGNDFQFVGGSGAFAPTGEALLLARSRPGVHRVQLDGDELAAYRERFPAWRDADAFTVE